MSDQAQDDEVDAWLRRPWTEQAFKIRDAIDYRNVCGIPFYGPATGTEDDPRLIRIPDGWDHEDCEICAKHISENPEDETVAYTNGEEWLCRACYEEHVLMAIDEA